jgi:hypothetical protein
MCAMRALVLALVITACSDDGGPTDVHAIVACDDAWMRNGYTACERACVASSVALNASGPACDAHTATGRVSCSKTFLFEGAVGCCASDPPKQLFGECD